MELKLFSYHEYLQFLVTVSLWGSGDQSQELTAERTQSWSHSVLFLWLSLLICAVFLLLSLSQKVCEGVLSAPDTAFIIFYFASHLSFVFCCRMYAECLAYLKLYFAYSVLILTFIVWMLPMCNYGTLFASLVVMQTIHLGKMFIHCL